MQWWSNLWWEVLYWFGRTKIKKKKLFANHKTSFCNERYEKETELSKEIWWLKRKNFVSWKTISQRAPFKECNLCLNEKLEISTFTINGRLFNSRNELISKCRHVNKFTMKSYMILKIDVSDTTALYFIFAILNVSWHPTFKFHLKIIALLSETIRIEKLMFISWIIIFLETKIYSSTITMSNLSAPQK